MLKEYRKILFEKVIIVAGARPNFMKIAPLCAEFNRLSVPYEIFYSGQHYDPDLFDVFKKDLGLSPGHLANITMTGNSIRDIQKIMSAFHDYMKKQEGVSCIIVVGDVNTTYACSIVAKRFDGIPLVHLEAGLRSYDQSMPEEMNRMTVDHLSDILLAPSEDAVQNLKDEGINNNVFMVGNIMIDSLVRCITKIKKEIKDCSMRPPYCVVTFHRPENVDNPEILSHILGALDLIGRDFEIIFPMHPRTAAKIEEFGFQGDVKNLKILPPQGYMDFLRLVYFSDFVITDSGGVQEETSYLNIPCFTVRKNTERPVTVRLGTNKLIHFDEIAKEYAQMSKERKQAKPIPGWDGQTAKRILSVLNKNICFI